MVFVRWRASFISSVAASINFAFPRIDAVSCALARMAEKRNIRETTVLIMD
jgi:hypothetical protein